MTRVEALDVAVFPAAAALDIGGVGVDSPPFPHGLGHVAHRSRRAPSIKPSGSLVRVLIAPPRNPTLPAVCRLPPDRREFAGFRAGIRSLKTGNGSSATGSADRFGVFVSGRKIPFPGKQRRRWRILGSNGLRRGTIQRCD